MQLKSVTLMAKWLLGAIAGVQIAGIGCSYRGIGGRILFTVAYAALLHTFSPKNLMRGVCLVMSSREIMEEWERMAGNAGQ